MPPPPVSGAAVGNVGTGVAVCVGGGVEALCVGGGVEELCVGGGVAEPEACDEPDADAPPWLVDDVSGAGDREPSPVGDGVRVPG